MSKFDFDLSPFEGRIADLTDDQLKHMTRTLLLVQHGCNDGKGKALFIGLYQGNRRVAAQLEESRYGRRWKLTEGEAESLGNTAIPLGVLHYRASKVQKRLGLSEHREWAPAWLRLEHPGLPDESLVVYRAGDPWGQDAECAADHDDDF